MGLPTKEIMWIVELQRDGDWYPVEECRDFALAEEIMNEYLADGRPARLVWINQSSSLTNNFFRPNEGE